MLSVRQIAQGSYVFLLKLFVEPIIHMPGQFVEPSLRWNLNPYTAFCTSGNCQFLDISAAFIICVFGLPLRSHVSAKAKNLVLPR